MTSHKVIMVRAHGKGLTQPHRHTWLVVPNYLGSLKDLGVPTTKWCPNSNLSSKSKEFANINKKY